MSPGSGGALPTAALAITPPYTPPTTAALIPQVAALRYEADLIQAKTVSLDRRVHEVDLDRRTDEWQMKGVLSLLTAISERWGMGWSELARTVGVSVPALRKWRLGESASPANRRALARLAATLEMLSDQFMIEDPASWLEIPLADSTLSLVDAYAAGRQDLVIEYAGRRIDSAEQLLAEFAPNWQAGLDARFETYPASDGHRAIRERDA